VKPSNSNCPSLVVKAWGDWPNTVTFRVWIPVPKFVMDHVYPHEELVEYPSSIVVWPWYKIEYSPACTLLATLMYTPSAAKRIDQQVNVQQRNDSTPNTRTFESELE
jgi:hypothetical protein